MSRRSEVWQFCLAMAIFLLMILATMYLFTLTEPGPTWP